MQAFFSKDFEGTGGKYLVVSPVVEQEQGKGKGKGQEQGKGKGKEKEKRQEQRKDVV